ncbi:hypothetical protein [Acinetobacter sp. BSP-53]|uniref:hypothetical protein n=1 Tax=Acinetobacter sp. BSP-53 TaxID=3344662 RepID=UPI00376FF985
MRSPDQIGITWEENQLLMQQLREKAALENRRQHNIFEVGDKVVYYTLPHERLFYVKAVLNGSIVVHECLDELSARCFSEFNPYDEIRHATDAEIEAGKRLEVD